jgi:diguanylate cyclase (GGDEF)-like protein
VTLSIGVTVVEPTDTLDGLIARADEAMYRAKRAGKNRVVAIGAASL